MPNVSLIAHGSTGSEKDQNKKAFQAPYEGYTENAEGLALAVSEYGEAGIVKLVNMKRAAIAVSAERARLMSTVKEEQNNKADVFDLIAAAESMEEKQALMEAHGLA